MIVSDSGMKGRVLGLLAPPVDDTAPPVNVPAQAAAQHRASAEPQAAAEHEALQVLTLAQRTAEEHLISARREADRICGEARDRVAQIIRDAEARGKALQRDAEAALSDAHAAAAKIANDARARADQAQQEAEEILSDAHVRADEVTKLAQAKADERQHAAERRYEDVVGNLAAKREALQQQIEALEQFDREYRARLQAFMQSQLRALWVDEPGVDTEGLEHPDSNPTEASAPAQRDDSEQPPDRVTAGS